MNGFNGPKKYNDEINEIVEKIQRLTIKMAKDTDSPFMRFTLDTVIAMGFPTTIIACGGLSIAPGSKPKKDTRNPAKVADELLADLIRQQKGE